MTRPLALITGGSRGIGRAIVLDLAERGHDIVFSYRSQEAEAAAVAEQARAFGARALAARCDVADHDAVARWVGDTERSVGPIEAVVNCAGITRDRSLAMMSAEDWQQVVQTNLGGVFNVCRAAVFPMLKRRRGCIVNLSSVSGVYGNPTQSNYSAAKAGIIGFSRALSKEVGAQGIRVNVVAPGLIETDMTAQLSPAALDRFLSRAPLQRIGTPKDVANAVAFLCSDQSAYVTGQVLGVDGGLVF